MQKIVAADDTCIRIRKQRISKAHLLTVQPICFHGIDADGGETKTARVEIRKPSLKIPQLGVTEWSQVAAIENQQRVFAREKIGERNLFAPLIR